jgi:pyruvate/2-oxoglutarate dehydrogenase complex dihydrolipoamide dehydrogenase (E3) component
MSQFSAAPKIKPNDENVFQRRVRPEHYQNPAPASVYDLVVLGAGPAGITAAETAARLGARVALIERNRLGGNSLNAGSIPSKSIIKSAGVYSATHKAEEFGVPIPTTPALDFARVIERMRRIRTRIAEHYSVDRLRDLGIDLYFDTACFDTADSLRIRDTSLRFKKAIIATGARPKAPDEIPGLEETGYLTSASIFDLDHLPKRLAVIGGGPLGCELAQAFCRLGSQVTIVQNDPKFLPREERDAAEILSRALARDGVGIRLNTTVVGARKADGAKVLQTVNNDVKSDIEADEILLSIGRVANIQDLNLEKAGIAIDSKRSVDVDDFLRTKNPAVYAAGDVCMDLKFTNAAQASAGIAVRNALLGSEERQSALKIPWCTYCEPEIAHIGLNVWDARLRSVPIKSYTVLMHDVDRAITDSSDAGFVKIHIAENTDRILGATIVASRASELVNEMSVIMSAGIGMHDLAAIVHTYPAESGAILLAAQAWLRDKHRREDAEVQRASSPGPQRSP